MALLFCDSFDHYATAQIGRKWFDFSSALTINTTNGRRSTRSLRNTNSSTQYARRNFGTNAATIIVGFALKITGGVSQSGYVLGFYDGSSDQMTLFINTDGTLNIRRGTTSVATSVASLNVTGAYQYLEIKVVHGAAGSYEIRLDGANILSASGVDTTNTASNYATGVSLFNRIASTIGGFSAGTNVDIDDLYICDGTGTANNDFLGDRRVDCYFPNGNGNSSQLTGSDGNSTDNYLLVSETTPDDDTSYVQSATVNQKDTYATANMSHTPSAINGVQVNIYARKDDAGGLRSIASVTRSGGADTDGATRALSSGYQYHSQIVESDPNTAAAWTQSGFDNAEFGVKVAA